MPPTNPEMLDGGSLMNNVQAATLYCLSRSASPAALPGCATASACACSDFWKRYAASMYRENEVGLAGGPLLLIEIVPLPAGLTKLTLYSLHVAGTLLA